MMRSSLFCLSLVIVQFFAIGASVAQTPKALPTIHPAALPATPFQAVTPVVPRRNNSRYGTFTFAGPVESSFVLLPPSVYEVVSDTAGHLVGAGPHEAYQ